MLAIFCTMEKQLGPNLKQHKMTYVASTSIPQNPLQWGKKKMPVFPTYSVTHLGCLGIIICF